LVDLRYFAPHLHAICNFGYKFALKTSRFYSSE
jgi:hypothetical protein